MTETLDALFFNNGPVTSFPMLSLNPAFQRRWPSLYDAVEEGRIDAQALFSILVEQIPTEGICFYSLDTWPYPRPRASTLSEREYIYQASNAVNGGSITIGYSYSTLAYIPKPNSSWALPLSVERIKPSQTYREIAACQIQRLSQERKHLPHSLDTVACDGKYGNYRFFRQVKGLNCGVVARLRKDRVLYREPEVAEPGKRGRPRKHGQRFAFKAPSSWGPPDEIVEFEDPRWGLVRLERWNSLHDRRAADCPFDVVKVSTHLERKKPSGPIWLAWIEPGKMPKGIQVTAKVIWEAFQHRWPIEPAVRFCKQRLGLVKPQFHKVEYQDVWVWLVLLTLWLLFLAIGLVEQKVLPWQKKQGENPPAGPKAGPGNANPVRKWSKKAPVGRKKSEIWVVKELFQPNHQVGLCIPLSKCEFAKNGTQYYNSKGLRGLGLPREPGGFLGVILGGDPL